MAETEKGVLEGLSKQAQQLAIGMCHFSHNGGRLDAIEATSGMEKEEFDKALLELSQRGLVLRGSWDSKTSQFIQDGETAVFYRMVQAFLESKFPVFGDMRNCSTGYYFPDPAFK